MNAHQSSLPPASVLTVEPIRDRRPLNLGCILAAAETREALDFLLRDMIACRNMALMSDGVGQSLGARNRRYAEKHLRDSLWKKRDVLETLVRAVLQPEHGQENWFHPSTAPDGEDILLWRQDGHRKDNLYGVREVGSYDLETDTWYDGNGEEIAPPRAWCRLSPKPTSERLSALLGRPTDGGRS